MRPPSLRPRIVVAALVLCVSLVISFAVWTVVWGPLGGRIGPDAVTLSTKTTYITEPLRADGSVDYLAALNRRCSEGVTVENNASVLIWQALGPQPYAAATRDAFFELLGIPMPPLEGDYFISLEQWAIRKYKTKVGADDSPEDQQRYVIDVEGQFDVGCPRAWTKDESPVLAEWLDANEKPLALVIEATRRSHRYDPMLVAEDETDPVLTADIALARESRVTSGCHRFVGPCHVATWRGRSSSGVARSLGGSSPIAVGNAGTQDDRRVVRMRDWQESWRWCTISPAVRGVEFRANVLLQMELEFPGVGVSITLKPGGFHESRTQDACWT